jgi:opacity protein-like surface antigen
MFKSLTSLIGLLFLATFATTQVNAQDDKYFSKLYIGGETGYIDIGTNNGFALGGFIGGRYQTDSNLVLGLELDINGTVGEDNNIGLASFLGTIGIATGKEKRNLFYVGGGYEGAFGLDDSAELFGGDDGYSIVGGYERALSDHIALRLQAKYISFGDSNQGDSSSDGVSVLAGVSFNF